MQIYISNCSQKSNTERVDLVRCTVNGRTREKANVGWYCILYSFKFRSQYNHNLCQLFYLANRAKQRNSLWDVPFLFRPPPMDEYPQQTASRNPFSKGPTKRSKGSDKKVRWQESAHPPGGIGKNMERPSQSFVCMSQQIAFLRFQNLSFEKVKMYAHYYQITPLYPLYLGERLLKVAIVSGHKLFRLKLSKARRQNERKK